MPNPARSSFAVAYLVSAVEIGNLLAAAALDWYSAVGPRAMTVAKVVGGAVSELVAEGAATARYSSARLMKLGTC